MSLFVFALFLQIFCIRHLGGVHIRANLISSNLIQQIKHFRTPEGLEDVSKYPVLFAALLESEEIEWTEEDLAKLASKNLIRVFKGRVCERMSCEQSKIIVCLGRHVP